MIRFDHFMAQANAAYYATKNPFADFTTAPELTQVFGEILGAWAKYVWQTMMQRAENIILVEAGPGTGKLMADILRVFPKPSVHLIETSPALRAAQAKRIPHAAWHHALDTIPHLPMILIANEFLDALPVRQFVHRETGWMERYVENAAYVEIPADYAAPDPIGSVREVNEPARALIRALAARKAVALFIDYGAATGETAETVQAIRNNAYADPLTTPGETDITAHVDFAALAKTALAAGAVPHGPIPQKPFPDRARPLPTQRRFGAKQPGNVRKPKTLGPPPHRPRSHGHPLQGLRHHPPKLPPPPRLRTMIPSRPRDTHPTPVIHAKAGISTHAPQQCPTPPALFPSWPRKRPSTPRRSRHQHKAPQC